VEAGFLAVEDSPAAVVAAAVAAVGSQFATAFFKQILVFSFLILIGSHADTDKNKF
jgi:hypothetical protein